MPSDPVADLEACKGEYRKLGATERESITQSRVGQGSFRDALTAIWIGCSVTGLEDVTLLRASHIKPWRVSTNEERLDPDNGLLLHPALDHLFDMGLITFMNDGRIRISQRLTNRELKTLGIERNMKLRRVTEKMEKYLNYHREGIFKKR